jgi:xylulokinase
VNAPNADLYIGLDLGTSGLKAVAIRGSGQVIARASAAYPTSRPASRAAEQDPQDWLLAVEQVAAGLAAKAPPRRWRAIGLSGMIPTLVTAGKDGEPNGPAITWEDSRAEEHAVQLRERFGAMSGTPGGTALYRITGQRVDGRYLLPMFNRLAEEDPGRAAATATLLSAKDYLFWFLTGVAATDPSTATGFGCFGLETGQWNQDVLAAGFVTGRRPELPPVFSPVTTMPLRAQVAARLGCELIPVCLGAADSVLGAFGLGARSRGQIAYVAGTSTVILGIVDKPLLDPDQRFLVTPLAQPGLWGLEMDLLATGSALRWLAELLGDGLDEADVMSLAAATDPADAPVVLPYLSPGEQGALWDPALYGTITGLTLAHGRPHLARGLVNGIVLESRRCLAVLDETAGFGPDLLVAGRSAAAGSFRADLADATGRSVLAPGGTDADFSARGAAVLAATAASRQADDPATHSVPEESIPEPGVEATVLEPDPRRTETWRALWLAHERALRMLRTAHENDRQSRQYLPPSSCKGTHGLPD